MIKDDLHGTISEIKIQYIPALSWRKRGFIISQDTSMNPAFNGSERLRAINQLQEKQYQLQILNTTEEDLGLYIYDAQLDSISIETKVMLKLAGNTII